MAKQTSVNLRKSVIYSVFVRNFTEEGTFNAVIPELDRLKELGTDIVWFLPMYPIGEVNRKGADGSPYAIKDYRSVDPNYGTIEEFETLIEEIHNRGMKVMIDIVYNHTSPDSILTNEHPDWFYKTAEGNFGNRVGDWSDIVDLDYKHPDLWDYQIETLKQWVKRGVDGFRCDVAPLVPIEFWLRARKEVEEVNPEVIWLSESVHPEFIRELRSRDMVALSDSEIYQAFDMTYDYDVHDHFESYLEGNIDLEAYVERLKVQDYTYPWNYVKMRNLENHDHLRIRHRIPKDSELMQWTAFTFMQKGSSLVYNGQEVLAEMTPSLFDRDTINWESGHNISDFIAKLSQIKKEYVPLDGLYSLEADNKTNTIILNYKNAQQTFVGAFNLKDSEGMIDLPVQDGEYTNYITDEKINIKDGKIDISHTPIVFIANNY
ncbi:alpha-amylase [Aerococcaceae bacterium DSM 111021]|nr:alpha-amylase [Aerococcaceae bacterium DSM 111021]